MPHISDRFTAILDANVLYPFLVRDVLLSLADAGLYRARWTDEIMDEWTRNLVARHPDKRELIDRTTELMTTRFPESLVEGYEVLVHALDLPDPNDRHVLAAAINSGAHVIVTENTRDFPEKALAPHELEAHTPDIFTLNTIELYPSEAVKALRTMRQRYNNPAYTASDLILAMARSGLVTTATELRAHIDVL